MQFTSLKMHLAIVLLFCASYAQATCRCEQITNIVNGRRVCACNQGYAVSPSNPAKCQDIDECQDPNQNACQQNCTNTIGSYSCSCNSGFIINSTDPTKCDSCTDHGFTIHNGLCYIFLTPVDTYNNTKNKCLAKNATPVRVRSADDIEFFFTMARNMDGSSFWVGATDIENEGQFIWEDTRQPITVDFEQWFDASTNTDDMDCLIGVDVNRIVATSCTALTYGVCTL
ncbi:adhesion G protein-coupled receptor E2-like [Physella acuta]|uniref:adhesion G protein-coupled receptor E2-like n=1 Tax=Physella acuta TaxID=109671 RepID=UPI0027DE9EE5|nr:adhesion G protein-coupled receptor E2-like [Physella acuta]